ncbi:MAG: hypothetical protein HKN21_10370 [Candidatus Eisenbacteria bacterium]|uniref:Uncharacterized protein n=1 Tax=Eiseniibacteriota bacterium TaxID=2212470 RepID=A0A7Y2E8H2_UNCEI|nr:hypothetical protein [Candidatus Eisenbacteria bacterium]
MTNFPADLQTLERMRAGADLLSRWGDKVGHAEDPLLYLEDCLLESTRTEPARSEKLLAKVRQSVGRHLKGVDEA